MRSDPSTTVTVSLPNGPALQLTVVYNCAHLRTSSDEDSPAIAYLLDRHQDLHAHLPYSQQGHDEIVRAVRLIGGAEDNRYRHRPNHGDDQPPAEPIREWADEPPF